MTQLSGLFWFSRHFGQTVRLCVGTCQWQPAAGRAVGGVASDQLWHAVCIRTNADMLTRWVPNSRARQSASYCPLSAGELDGGSTVFFLSFSSELLFWCPDAHVMCTHDAWCVFRESCALVFELCYLCPVCLFMWTHTMCVCVCFCMHVCGSGGLHVYWQQNGLGSVALWLHAFLFKSKSRGCYHEARLAG